MREVRADLPELVREAMARRPDLKAAEHRSQAARRETDASVGAWIPHLNGFFEATLDADEMFSRQGESWTTGAVLTWELFSGGRTLGRIREARARAAAAEAKARFDRDQAEREVRQAYRDVQTARKRVGVAEAALEQARERLRVTELQYREGLATTTDLLAAQAGVTEARVRRVKALHDVNVGIARVAFVTGGRR